MVGLGIGGREAEFPPEPFARAFQIARDGGLGSVLTPAKLPGLPLSAAPSTLWPPTGRDPR